MATKTYMPAVERRIIVRRNPVFGIINYDADNAYPQRVLELVRQSPTAKSCWGKRAKYLSGNGFEEAKLGEVVINPKGLTMAKLLKQIGIDKGLFPGFGLHVNYNANYKAVSVNFVKYEDIRQGDTDSEIYRGKYVIYRDWGRKTWRSIYASKFDVIDPFNPDPAVIREQVIAAGGWDKYKGQLFYLTPVIDDYELCEFDAALEDIETESGIKVFNNRQVTTGFMPAAMLFMPTRREESDNAGVNSDNDESYGYNQPTQMEQNLATFQGAKEAQKIIVIEYDGDATNKPELSAYNMQNNDKLFDATSKSVEGNIIKAFNVPKEMVSTDSNNGLSNGGEKSVAIKELNDITAPERQEISEVLAKVFAHFYININPSGNWNITEVTTDGLGKDMLTNAKDIQAVIESSVMKRDNKVAYLINVYGFRQAEAEAMVPIEEVEPPVDKPIETDIKQEQDQE